LGVDFTWDQLVVITSAQSSDKNWDEKKKKEKKRDKSERKRKKWASERVKQRQNHGK
jgi:hypothetical protein